MASIRSANMKLPMRASSLEAVSLLVGQVTFGALTAHSGKAEQSCLPSGSKIAPTLISRIL
jgi:hypothetical protein